MYFHIYIYVIYITIVIKEKETINLVGVWEWLEGGSYREKRGEVI